MHNPLRIKYFHEALAGHVHECLLKSRIGKARILLFLLASSVAAQELPSQTDLRAAYCIPIVQDALDVISPLLTLTDSAQLTEDLTTLVTEDTDNLRRLNLYLAPRIPHLEPLGLATAAQRAKEDLKQYEQHGKSCATKCQQSVNKQRVSEDKRASAEGACKRKCFAESPVRSRFEECHDLRWLPY